MGIIGRNGAGKSTLLKILSRITEPTSGQAKIYGRVGSLLEVGTGFHPELTGGENIYLNGAILGMRQYEIDRKFDEIVAFAEIDKFLDTPVKRYSSGMYVRLAFAVAAHLEPEILVIDEVLAVGDAGFQKKCLGKMSDISQQGRTVLFVSHNMAAVASLCDEALLLESGKVEAIGGTEKVITEYTMGRSRADIESTVYRVDEQLLNTHQEDDRLDLVITGIELFDDRMQVAQEIKTGDSLCLRIHYSARRKFVAPAFMVSITDRFGVELTRLSTMPISGFYIEEIAGQGKIDLCIDDLPFTGGMYFLSIAAARANVEWILQLEQVVTMNITPSDVYQSGLALDNGRGVVALNHKWHLYDEINVI